MPIILFQRVLVGRCIMQYGVRSCLAAVGLLALVGQAHASLVVNLNTSDPAAGLPAGTLATVTVTNFTSGLIFGVTVDVAPILGVNFVNSGGPHTPFVFNVDSQLFT